MKARSYFVAFASVALATVSLAACGTNTNPPTSSPVSSNSNSTPRASVAFRRPHASCASTSQSYGPVLVNGAPNSSYTTPILSVNDVSGANANGEWELAESIVNGPTDSTMGPTTVGTNKVSIYDFAGKIINTSAPDISGFAPMTTDVYAWSPLPTCNLSKVVFDYSYNWSTYAVPFGPLAESGTMAQSATFTYPAQPTPGPTSTPSPLPTPCIPVDHLGSVYSNGGPPTTYNDPVASKPLIKDLGIAISAPPNQKTQYTFVLYFRNRTATNPGVGTAEFKAWNTSGTLLMDTTYNVSGYGLSNPATITPTVNLYPCATGKVSVYFDYTAAGVIESGLRQTDVLQY